MKRSLHALFSLACIAGSATAADYTVTTATDHAFTSVNPANGQITGGAGTGTVSLRSAVIAANSNGVGPHTINLPAALGPYNLSTDNPVNPGGTATNGFADLQIGSHLSTVTLRGTGGMAKITQTVPATDVITTGFRLNGFITEPAVVNLTLDQLEITGGTFTGVFVGADDGLGKTSVTTITNCNIHGNSNADATFGQGGAIQAITGTLNISNSTFANNSATDAAKGQGGAIYYSLPNAVGIGSTGGLSITDCTFTNNQSGLSGGIGGGAIYASVSSSGANLAITGCTFTSNSTTAGSSGGAVAIDGGRAADILENKFINNSVGGSARGGAIVVNSGAGTIQYNSFEGNTSAAVAGNTIHNTVGNAGLVNANNNWWRSNSGPAAGAISGASVTSAKWLRLSHAAAPSTVSVLAPDNTSTLTAGFLTNSASEAIATADLSTLIGKSITFGNPAFGALSAAQTTIQANGTATATFTAGASAGSGGADATVDSVTANAPITVLASQFAIAGASASESAGSVDLTVTRSSSTSGSVTVDYAVTSNTASATTDFTAVSGTLTFGNGETTKNITVAIASDDLVELNESFTATISNPSSGSVITAVASGTITNDDSAVISISGGSTNEGDTGTAALTFTVALTRAVDVDVTVSRATTASGSASSGTDFTALTAATFTVPAGNTSATFNVPVIGDHTVEPDETIGAEISSLSNSGRSVTLGTSTGTGTIIDDDPLLVAATGALAVTIGTSGKLTAAELLALTTPVEGRPVSLVSVQSLPTAMGGTVSITEGWVYYQPPAGFSGTDSFTYTITDGIQTVTGTVSITTAAQIGSTLNIYRLVDESGGKRLLCLGIPGRSYQLEISSLSDPWTPSGPPVICPAHGAMSLLDPAPLPPSRFYRLVQTAP